MTDPTQKSKPEIISGKSKKLFISKSKKKSATKKKFEVQKNQSFNFFHDQVLGGCFR
uniref:Uncharacterized protein n=1 Tax=viral metagenome TaxID=1070528 RepID=A0A6C0BNK8_9ZZZZ